MDVFLEFLTGYGYWGMLLGAFIAGSVFPFSSETMMLMLLGSGLDGGLLVIYGTIGNVLGSVFNYFVGRLGKLEWIEKYLRIKKKNMNCPTLYGRARCLDGLLCFSAHHRQCHHGNPGIYASQHANIIPQHYHRQVPTLLAAHLWR